MKALLVPLCLAGAALAAEPLPLLTVEPRSVAAGFLAEAVIEARDQAEVAAQVAGRVLEARADAGEAVHKGQVLMRLDAREATEAAAAAAAQYGNAKASYERNRRLVEQGFLSAAALDKAKAEYDAAAANRSAAAAAQSHTLILAPISGIVARRHAEVGDMAQPGRPLFTVFAPNALRAVASVPQARLRELRPPVRAQVLFPELGRRLDAAGVTLLPTVDNSTHTAQVRVALPAAGGVLAGVTPGMAARVRFLTGSVSKLTVPAGAVVHRGELAAVYVQAADGGLSLRQLRLGEIQGEAEVEVLAGLVAGERLVTDPVRAAIQLKAGK